MTNLYIPDGINIPEYELEISASRAGGPGGQHVNKTSSRITIRWHVQKSSALNEDQKRQIEQVLATRITSDGYLQISNSATRSQHENRKRAIAQLEYLVAKALHVPKTRTATKISHATQQQRLKKKTKRSEIKKMRRKPIEGE